MSGPNIVYSPFAYLCFYVNPFYWLCQQKFALLKHFCYFLSIFDIKIEVAL